jgi:hypothetical protein
VGLSRQACNLMGPGTRTRNRSPKYRGFSVRHRARLAEASFFQKPDGRPVATLSECCGHCPAGLDEKAFPHSFQSPVGQDRAKDLPSDEPASHPLTVATYTGRNFSRGST